MAQMRARSCATLVRVVDGDTVILRMVCPCCRIGSEQRVRLARIDAPELDEKENDRAVQSWAALSALLRDAWIEVYVCRAWPDLYGRVIAEVYANGVCVSDTMLASGMAVPYENRVRRRGPYAPGGPHGLESVWVGGNRDEKDH